MNIKSKNKSKNKYKGGLIDYKPLEPEEQCKHPCHNPPSMMVYPEGHHTYQCPGCGHITRFTVRYPKLLT